MKERPILMHDRSVRGILDERKTQTRRVVKPQPDLTFGDRPISTHQPATGRSWGPDDARGERREGGWYVTFPGFDTGPWKCPYGSPGDRLYVRETWAASSLWDDYPPSEIPEDGTCLWYRADDGARGPAGGLHPANRGRWRPSIHMPKWAPRIWLEVADVRVERVQEISAEDCMAEGVTISSPHSVGHRAEEYRREFARLWNDTNAHRDGCTWEDNPWVWVVAFERVEVP